LRIDQARYGLPGIQVSMYNLQHIASCYIIRSESLLACGSPDDNTLKDAIEESGSSPKGFCRGTKLIGDLMEGFRLYAPLSGPMKASRHFAMACSFFEIESLYNALS